ncbi:MAG: hypothetical protein VX642_04640 [Bdellovibrionota bacterium]|nr:hypothetical protein [Bdellovibrionota bacterium]
MKSREDKRKKLAFTPVEMQLMAKYPIADGLENHVALTTQTQDLLTSQDAEAIIIESLSYNRVQGAAPNKLLVSQVLPVGDRYYRLAAYFVEDAPILDIDIKEPVMEAVERFYRIRFAVFLVGTKSGRGTTGVELVDVVDMIQGSRKNRETISGYSHMLSYGPFGGFEIDYLLQYYVIESSIWNFLIRIPQFIPSIATFERVTFSPIATSETNLWDSLTNSSGQAIEASELRFLGPPTESYTTKYVAVKRISNVEATDPFVIFDTDDISELATSKILKTNLESGPKVTKVDFKTMTIDLEENSTILNNFSIGTIIIKKDVK